MLNLTLLSFTFQRLMATEAKLFNTQKELEKMRDVANHYTKLKEHVGCFFFFVSTENNYVRYVCYHKLDIISISLLRFCHGFVLLYNYPSYV
jgi:hypothetical protein